MLIHACFTSNYMSAIWLLICLPLCVFYVCCNACCMCALLHVYRSANCMCAYMCLLLHVDFGGGNSAIAGPKPSWERRRATSGMYLDKKVTRSQDWLYLQNPPHPDSWRMSGIFNIPSLQLVTWFGRVNKCLLQYIPDTTNAMHCLYFR